MRVAGMLAIDYLSFSYAPFFLIGLVILHVLQ